MSDTADEGVSTQRLLQHLRKTLDEYWDKVSTAINTAAATGLQVQPFRCGDIDQFDSSGQAHVMRHLKCWDKLREETRSILTLDAVRAGCDVVGTTGTVFSGLSPTQKRRVQAITEHCYSLRDTLLVAVLHAGCPPPLHTDEALVASHEVLQTRSLASAALQSIAALYKDMEWYDEPGRGPSGPNRMPSPSATGHREAIQFSEGMPCTNPEIECSLRVSQQPDQGSCTSTVWVDSSYLQLFTGIPARPDFIRSVPMSDAWNILSEGRNLIDSTLTINRGLLLRKIHQSNMVFINKVLEAHEQQSGKGDSSAHLLTDRLPHLSAAGVTKAIEGQEGAILTTLIRLRLPTLLDEFWNSFQEKRSAQYKFLHDDLRNTEGFVGDVSRAAHSLVRSKFELDNKALDATNYIQLESLKLFRADPSLFDTRMSGVECASELVRRFGPVGRLYALHRELKQATPLERPMKRAQYLLEVDSTLDALESKINQDQRENLRRCGTWTETAEAQGLFGKIEVRAALSRDLTGRF